MIIGTIVGNVGQDPAVKEGQRGTYTRFSVGSSQGKDKPTSWVNVVAYGKTGENAAKYLQRGSQCAVSGRMELREYEDKSGAKRTSLDCYAFEIKFLGRPKQQQQESGDLGDWD